MQRLRANAAAFMEAARRAGLDTGTSIGSSVVPVMTGSSVRAAALSQRLFDRGVNVQPIIYPAIPERLARLRFFLSSEHTLEQIEQVVPIIASEFEAAAATSVKALARGVSNA